MPEQRGNERIILTENLLHGVSEAGRHTVPQRGESTTCIIKQAKHPATRYYYAFNH
jgi:hypothetical protein